MLFLKQRDNSVVATLNLIHNHQFWCVLNQKNLHVWLFSGQGCFHGKHENDKKYRFTDETSNYKMLTVKNVIRQNVERKYAKSGQNLELKNMLTGTKHRR